MTNDLTIRVGYQTGLASLQGIEQPSGEVVEFASRLIAIKVPGYSAWAGRGQDREYVASSIQIYRYTDVAWSDHKKWWELYRCELVMELPVKSKVVSPERLAKQFEGAELADCS